VTEKNIFFIADFYVLGLLITKKYYLSEKNFCPSRTLKSKNSDILAPARSPLGQLDAPQF
jgi:hypothetical protein